MLLVVFLLLTIGLGILLGDLGLVLGAFLVQLVLAFLVLGRLFVGDGLVFGGLLVSGRLLFG